MKKSFFAAIATMICFCSLAPAALARSRAWMLFPKKTWWDYYGDFVVIAVLGIAFVMGIILLIVHISNKK